MHHKINTPHVQKFFERKTTLFVALFFVLVIVLFISLAYFSTVLSATYTWTQTDWSGGATANTAVHPGDQSGWTEFNAKDAGIDTTSSSTQLTLSSTVGSTTETTDTDFLAGTLSNATTTGSGTSTTISLNITALGDVWTQKANYPETVGLGARIAGIIASDGYIYALHSSKYVYRYSVSGDSWGTTWQGIYDNLEAGASISTYDPQSRIFVGNSASLRYGNYGVSFGNMSFQNDPENDYTPGSDVFWPGFGSEIFILKKTSYNSRPYFNACVPFSYSSYTPNFTQTSVSENSAVSLASPGSAFDHIYILPNYNSTEFKAYSISQNSWTDFDPTDPPVSPGEYSGLGSGPGYVFFVASSTNTTYKYSAETDEWTVQATTPPIVPYSWSYDPATGKMYANTFGASAFYEYTPLNTYAMSGDFTSKNINAGGDVDFTTFDFTATVPTNTTIQLQIRSAATEGELSSATWYGPTGVGDYYTTSGESINSIHDGDQWFQYKVFFATSDATKTPSFDSVTINYQSYAADSSTLTSSPYNTTDTANTLAGIAWTEDLGTYGNIQFQIRTATSSANLASAEWYGPTGTSSYFTDYTGGDALPNEISDGINDQWVQYKIYLSTTNTAFTPTLSDVTLTYVVNGTPIVDALGNDGGGALDQDEDGVIRLQYDTRDIDNTSVESYFLYDIGVTLADEGGVLGVTDNTNIIVNNSQNLSATGTVMIGTELIDYITNDTASSTLSGLTRGTWPGNPSWDSTVTEHPNGETVYLLAQTTTGEGDKSVTSATSTFTGTTNPSADIPNVFLSDATVAVAINDGELANMVGVATSSAFTLDTTPPSGGSLLFDSINDQLTITTNDTSPVQMRLSNNSDLSGDGTNSDSGSWIAYGTDGNFDDYGDIPLQASVSKSWTGSDNDIETIYVRFRDNKGNYSATTSVDTPRTPGNFIYRDVSNVDIDDYKLFIAWGVIPTPAPGFKHYRVYRSENGGAFTLFSTITDRSENFFIDSGLSTSTEYSYKIYSEDNDGNRSNYSTTVTDRPNGQGGSDLTPPTITNVSAVNLVPQGVEISWTTDELANSTVGFSEDTSYSNEQGSPTMTTDHSVILSDLTPNTTYYYRVRSDDPTGNASNWSNGYQFTTPPGPAISNVTVPEITSATAKISWITDIPADSFVVYSNNANMASSSEIGTTVLTTNHSITLSGLTEGETYYYYVKSTDESMNESTDTKAGEYYMFVTTIDNTGPVISNVTVATVSDTQATVTWTTDENSTSQIFYGTDVSYGASSTLDSTLSIRHSVTLTGLTKETDYLFKVASNDVGGNASEDDNNGSGYAFTTTDEPGITQIIESDPPTVMTDTTPPNATNLQITNIGSTTATISWFTSEQGNSLVVYGHTTNYGFLDGDIDVSTSNHSVTLQRLEPARLHHFKTVSIDDAGNVGSSEQNSFTTLDKDGKEVEDAPPPTTETDDENEEIVDPEEVELPGLDEEMADAQNIVLSTIDQASEAFITAMLKALPANPNISNIPEAAFVDSVAEIAPKIVSPPEIASQDLTVEVGPDWAEFTWITNKRSSGLVSVAHEDDFDGTYTKTEGNADTLITNHRVRIDGLESQSVYHYSVQSKGQLGDWARSPDATFTTTSLLFEIIDFSFDQISTTDAAISWETTLPTRSTIEVTDTATGEIFTYEDDSFLREHTFKIDGLALSTSYVAQVIAEDEDSNISSSSVLPFTTQASLDPAVINQVRTTTALVPGQIERVQTIISWKTDKPATSRVLFEEGVSPSSELAQSTQLQTNLTKDHVVVTTQFKPGRVYRFRIESIDGIGNRSVSKDYTILTPAPEENVLDLILDNFEDNFEFLKRMRF